MSWISLGKMALGNGARYRMVLKGKQLEALPDAFKPLISNIERPVVHVGINARGTEGSMYGIKVFAKGKNEPVAAAAGRIDYREAEPILQARGFVKKNTGAGDALRANVQMDTKKAIDLENMDELVLVQRQGVLTATAKSDALNADIVLDKAACEEILNFAGIQNKIDFGRKNLANGFERIRKKLARTLNEINPFATKYKANKFMKKADFDPNICKKGAPAEVSDITKYAAEHADKIKAAKKAEIMKSVECMRKDLEEIAKTFKTTSDQAVKTKLAAQYTELQEKLSSNLKYIENCFKDV